MKYRLSCTQCSYGTVVDGLERAFDLREDHLEEYGEPHFVDFVRIDAVEADAEASRVEAESRSEALEGDSTSGSVESD